MMSTITEILDENAAEMCDKYCKYPETWDEEKDGQLCDSEICENCPLNKF